VQLYRPLLYQQTNCVRSQQASASFAPQAVRQDRHTHAPLAPHVYPTLRAVVARALALQKTGRYPDAQTMRQDACALRRGRRRLLGTGSD
jgi:hypothetical protein